MGQAKVTTTLGVYAQVKGRSGQAEVAHLRAVRGTIKTQLLPVFGAKAISAVTVTDCEQFRANPAKISPSFNGHERVAYQSKRFPPRRAYWPPELCRGRTARQTASGSGTGSVRAGR